MCVAYYHSPQTGVRYKYENMQPFDDISSFQGYKEKPYLFQLLHMVRDGNRMERGLRQKQTPLNI